MTGRATETGVPGGELLMRFADAARPVHGRSSAERHQDGEALGPARAAIVARLGQEALHEAAATVAAFNGLVRVADGTGIQLDGGLDRVSAASRADLGIEAFGGAANTPRGGDAEPLVADPREIFGGT